MDSGGHDGGSPERLLREPAPGNAGRPLHQAPVTLLPIAEKPFILGAAGAISVWAATLNISRSLYS